MTDAGADSIGVLNLNAWNASDTSLFSYAKTPIQQTFFTNNSDLIGIALRNSIIYFAETTTDVDRPACVLGNEFRSTRTHRYQVPRVIDDKAPELVTMEVTTFAPIAFDYIRSVIGITRNDFRQSFDHSDLINFANTGRSGSQMYKTTDDVSEAYSEVVLRFDSIRSFSRSTLSKPYVITKLNFSFRPFRVSTYVMLINHRWSRGTSVSIPWTFAQCSRRRFSAWSWWTIYRPFSTFMRSTIWKDPALVVIRRSICPCDEWKLWKIWTSNHSIHSAFEFLTASIGAWEKRWRAMWRNWGKWWSLISVWCWVYITWTATYQMDENSEMTTPLNHRPQLGISSLFAATNIDPTAIRNMDGEESPIAAHSSKEKLIGRFAMKPLHVIACPQEDTFNASPTATSLLGMSFTSFLEGRIGCSFNWRILLSRHPWCDARWPPSTSLSCFHRLPADLRQFQTHSARLTKHSWS